MPEIDYKTYAEQSTSFLQSLVKTPSVNGRDPEAEVVKIIAQEAERLGLPYKLFEKQNGRPNIFVGEDFSSSDSILFVAHTDTVPEGDEKSWQHPPFSGEIVGGKLYGRGAFDCKGGIATSLYALKILKDMGQSHAAKFVGVVDEESGADSLFGLKYVLESGLKAKGAIYAYGNSAGEDSLTIGHRGLIRLWITCHGESAHSGSLSWQTREKGESAIEGIVEFLNNLQTLNFPGANPYFPKYSFTLTPTILSGGTSESIVPAEAKVLIDIRTLPEHNHENIIESIKAIVEKLKKPKRTYDIAIKNNIPAALSDPNSDFVKKVIATMGNVYQVKNQILKGSGPAYEGYMLIGNGIPTIAGFGAIGDGFHSKDEYVEVASLESSLRFLTELALG